MGEDRIIDLNSDVGEGFGAWGMGDDEAMLAIVTSANVACGFHAGDPTVMRRVCEMAASHGVVVGAQVGYPDLRGFGRRFVDIPPQELTDDVIYQIGALDAFCGVAGTRVRYVKPHGALYNRTVRDPAHAQAVVEAVRLYDPALPVLGLPGSRLLDLADEAGLAGVPEMFADRAYTRDAELVPRGEHGAVLHDPDVVAQRAAAMATTGTVTAIDGAQVSVGGRSLCVHGDTPGAVAIARAVRSRLIASGVRIAPFT